MHNKCQKQPKTNLVQTNKISSHCHVVGLINKGNTCYLNSILQLLASVTHFWTVAPEENYIPPLFKAVTLILSLLHKSTSAIDPSHLLLRLGEKIGQINNIPFNVRLQRDVPEVLQYVLDELVLNSPEALTKISTGLTYTFSCTVCFESSTTVEKLNILPLPLCSSVLESVNTFLSDEQLSGSNTKFCVVCGRNQETLKEIRVISCSEILFICLKRFSCLNGQPKKIEDLVKCNIELPVIIQLEEISFSVKYKLVGQVCHSGGFNQGHYWCNALRQEKWYQCNDELVQVVNPKNLDNINSYVLAYQKL